MNIKAAFRSPLSGNITVGNNHFEAFGQSDVPAIDEITEDQLLDGEGFLIDGIFYSREETYNLIGCSCVEHFEEQEKLKEWQCGKLI